MELNDRRDLRRVLSSCLSELGCDSEKIEGELGRTKKRKFQDNQANTLCSEKNAGSGV